MSRVFLIIGFVFSSYLMGNAQDYTGNWVGEFSFAKKTYYFSMNMLQEGRVITGTVIQGGAKKDSAQYYVRGTVEEGIAKLRGTSFIFKKGFGPCLPTINLTREADQLIGTYGPNVAWGGCVIGVKGNIQVTKKQSEVSIAQVEEPANQNFEVDDFEGNELIKALNKRKFYALIIAVNDYPDKEIPTLSKPIEDARLLKETLQNYYTFDDGTTTFLKDPTRTQIIETFDKLSKEVTNRDNLLIFFAGHGIWDNKLKQGFWLPTDASQSSKAQWLSNGTIRDYIRAIDSKHTLLITDACFGGSILKERGLKLNGKAMLEMYKRPSRKAMTSGALSTVPDESVFIKYLVKTLKNNQAPLISAEQLFGDFKVAVINNSESGQVPQYGAITLAGDEGGDFIFLKKDQ